MKQKEAEVKKILDRVRRNEITAKEAQKLIKALHGKQTVESQSGTWGVLLEKPKTTDTLCLVNVPVEETKEDEVQIELRACSISFGDLLCVKGLYPTQPAYPFVPGFEIAGVVKKVGSKVTDFQIGDPVIGITGSQMGGNCHYVNTSEKYLVKKPDMITFAEGCTLPVSFLTIHTILKQANLSKGMRVLIHSAAGGLGQVATQLMIDAGCQVFATVGSDEKADYLREHHISNVVNYRKEDFAQKILEWTDQQGVDVIINTLPGEYYKQNMKVLADEGQYFELANTGLRTSGGYGLLDYNNNKSFHNFNLRSYLGKHMDQIQEEYEIMIGMLKEGCLHPVLAKDFPITKIAEAYQYVENRKNIGKTVLSVPVEMLDSAEEPQESKQQENVKVESFEENMDIAVIGISGRFPASENLDEFWENLIEGKDLITEIPLERFKHSKETLKELKKVKCRYGGFLDNIEQFDPMFFNISALEAQEMDPQQRFFLEDCWNALEDAGYANDEEKELNCSVFGGTGGSDYMYAMNRDHEKLGPQAFWGNASSVVPARISYLLNLKGSSIAIDTACSSSLVAIHLACQSLRSRECDMAIAGGVFMNTTERFYLMSDNAGMLSPDGKCKTYDNGANGFVPGEGSGALVLKPYKKAVEDHDVIYGIIKGSLTNQDGKTNGLTAPSTISQTKLETEVYSKFHINPETISYIEAHGTGTKLGDPIEIEALTNSFSKFTDKKQFCAIGSVKTNMGHAAQAAGVASFIKVLLAFKHKELPPSLNYHVPNEHIHFEETPFYVVTERKKWEGTPQAPRRTAISSFGFSGTNAHIIVEEAFSNRKEQRGNRINQLIVLSAKNVKSLFQKAVDLKNWLVKDGESCSLEDIAYTLSVKRMHFQKRIGFVAKTKEQLVEILDQVIALGKVDTLLTQKGKQGGELDYDLIEKIVNQLSEDLEEKEEIVMEEQLLEQYKKGAEIPWRTIFSTDSCYTVSMPTYPFHKSSFWYDNIEKSETSKDLAETFGMDESGIAISGQSFQIKFTRDDFFIANHVIEEEYVVPGAVYLELAALAGNIQFRNKPLCIQDAVWIKKFDVPKEGLVLNASVSLHNGKYRFFVFQNNRNGQRELAFRCELSSIEDDRSLEKTNIIEQMNAQNVRWEQPAEFYHNLDVFGFHYGNAFQTVKKAGSDGTRVWEELERRESDSEKKEFILYPSMLDGLFQGALLFADQEVYLPYAVKEIRIYEPITKKAYGTIRKGEKTEKNEMQFHMELYNEEGINLVQVIGFKGRKR